MIFVDVAPTSGPTITSREDGEYACRAGTTTPFAFGKDITTDQVNYSGKKTVPVVSFEPNAFGLYQMHGNVYEWYKDSYDNENQVLRGGSWIQFPRNCRSAQRAKDLPSLRSDDVGFRPSW